MAFLDRIKKLLGLDKEQPNFIFGEKTKLQKAKPEFTFGNKIPPPPATFTFGEKVKPNETKPEFTFGSKKKKFEQANSKLALEIKTTIINNVGFLEERYASVKVVNIDDLVNEIEKELQSKINHEQTAMKIAGGIENLNSFAGNFFNKYYGSKKR